MRLPSFIVVLLTLALPVSASAGDAEDSLVSGCAGLLEIHQLRDLARNLVESSKAVEAELSQGEAFIEARKYFLTSGNFVRTEAAKRLLRSGAIYEAVAAAAKRFFPDYPTSRALKLDSLRGVLLAAPKEMKVADRFRLADMAVLALIDVIGKSQAFEEMHFDPEVTDRMGLLDISSIEELLALRQLSGRDFLDLRDGIVEQLSQEGAEPRKFIRSVVSKYSYRIGFKGWLFRPRRLPWGRVPMDFPESIISPVSGNLNPFEDYTERLAPEGGDGHYSSGYDPVPQDAFTSWFSKGPNAKQRVEFLLYAHWDDLTTYQVSEAIKQAEVMDLDEELIRILKRRLEQLGTFQKDLALFRRIYEAAPYELSSRKEFAEARQAPLGSRVDTFIRLLAAEIPDEMASCLVGGTNKEFLDLVRLHSEQIARELEVKAARQNETYELGQRISELEKQTGNFAYYGSGVDAKALQVLETQVAILESMESLMAPTRDDLLEALYRAEGVFKPRDANPDAAREAFLLGFRAAFNPYGTRVRPSEFRETVRIALRKIAGNVGRFTADDMNDLVESIRAHTRLIRLTRSQLGDVKRDILDQFTTLATQGGSQTWAHAALPGIQATLERPWEHRKGEVAAEIEARKAKTAADLQESRGALEKLLAQKKAGEEKNAGALAELAQLKEKLAALAVAAGKKPPESSHR